MIVEPTPTNPRAPFRRAMRLAGLVLPVVLLVAVIGAGALGPHPAPPPPAGSPQPSVAPAGSPPPNAQTASATTPAAFGDLTAIAPSAVVAARASGRVLGEVAVAGFLHVQPAGDACVTAALGPLGPWCERQGILAEAPWTGSGTSAQFLPPHLHVTIPVGVRLPEASPPADGSVQEQPVPVLVIGRFAPGLPACDQATVPCDHGFLVDRVAWANGTRMGLTPLVADRLDAGARPDPFTIAIDQEDLPLEAVLVWPRDVARLDADAALIAAREPASEPVWYVRVVDGARGPGLARIVRWMLLAERDLRVLGEGRPAGMGAASDPATRLGPPTLRTSGDSFPAVVANLPVQPVSAILDTEPSGHGPAVVAIAGYLRAWADPGACTAPIPGLPGGGCERQALLAQASWANSGSELFSGIGPFLHARVPPGVAIPDTAIGLLSSRPGPPPPVVVIGRFGLTGAGCVGVPGGCDQAFTIERVVWASGQPESIDRQIESGLVVTPGDPMTAGSGAGAGAVVGAASMLLRVVLVRRDALAGIDLEAARALARRGAGVGPVWYIRGLDVPGNPQTGRPDLRPVPVLRWVVVAARTGVLLAKG
jgi:hypothetical protein